MPARTTGDDNYVADKCARVRPRDYLPAMPKPVHVMAADAHNKDADAHH
jgi:hypothetical protein